MPTFALNFSRPGAQVVAQYYNFLRLGFEGYRRVQGYCPRRRDAPVVTDRGARAVRAAHARATSFRSSRSPLKDDVENFTVVRRLERAARARLAGPGVHVPARTARTSRRFAWSCGNGFTHDLADLLVADLEAPAPAVSRSRPRPSTTRPAERRSPIDVERRPAPTHVGAYVSASPSQKDEAAHALVIEGSDRGGVDRMTQMGRSAARAPVTDG